MKSFTHLMRHDMKCLANHNNKHACVSMFIDGKMSVGIVFFFQGLGWNDSCHCTYKLVTC